MPPIYIFAFFPYLRTGKPVRYNGIVFKKSDDIADMPEDAKQHFEILKSLFFLKDNYLLKNTTYALHVFMDAREDQQYFSNLREFQTIIAYLYSAPRGQYNDLFLKSEHASLYWFVPKDIFPSLVQESWETEVEQVSATPYPQPNSYDQVPGYDVYRDGQFITWATQGTRIYPPIASIAVNRSQDLAADLERSSHRSRPIIQYFNDPSRKRTARDRQLLRAIEWYNKANEGERDEQQSVLNLAIAFEALLNLQSEVHNKTQRFVESIGLLLGKIPRLVSWASQFYDARSDIVHEGSTERLHFIAADDLTKINASMLNQIRYKPLTAYGRQIFQLCLNTIITGAQLADDIRLSSQLTTNAERIARICKTLNDSEGSSVDRIMATYEDIEDLAEYQHQSEAGLTSKALIGVAKLMASQYLATNPEDSANLLAQINNLATATSDHSQLGAVKMLIDIFNAPPQLTQSASSYSYPSTRYIMASLLKVVWHYTFMDYYSLEREERERTSIKPV
jgi:hypothetical protein